MNASNLHAQFFLINFSITKFALLAFLTSKIFLSSTWYGKLSCTMQKYSLTISLIITYFFKFDASQNKPSYETTLLLLFCFDNFIN